MGTKLLWNLATMMCPMIPHTTLNYDTTRFQFVSLVWLVFLFVQAAEGNFLFKLKTPFILKERLKLNLLINFRNTLQGSDALLSHLRFN